MVDNYDLVIVGYGITGMLALATMPNEQRSSWRIAIIDAEFAGGDLGHKWGSINSNTTAKQIRDAFCRIISFQPLPKLALDSYADSQYVPLHEIASDMHLVTKSLKHATDSICDTVASLQQTTAPTTASTSQNQWTITFRHSHSPITSKRVLLCTGGVQRTMDISCPSLPLEVAFDMSRLPRVVKPKDVVTVFGTAHSGALVARNLHEVGARVFFVHSGKRPATETPFSFARNGDYDGVKGEAADVCDKITAGGFPMLTMVSYADGGAVANAVVRSKYVVYAIGFRARLGISLSLISTATSSENPDGKLYNATTGQIASSPGVWGFGIAYPSSTIYNGSTHYDVGIPSFTEHLLANWPAIVAYTS